MSETPIKMSATSTNPAATRAITEIQSKAFEEGEVLNVYITSDGHQVGGTVSDPITYCTTVNNGTDINALQPNPQPYYPTDGTIDIYALYPPRVKANTNNFVVDYTQQGESVYKNNDLMHASVQGQVMTDQTIHLQFVHKMAKIIINATGQEGVEVTGVKMINVKRSVPFTPETGDIGEATDQGDIVLEAGGAVLVPPQHVSGEFIEVSTDRIPARFSLDSKDFESGKEYTINLIVGLQSLGLTTNIVNWAKDAGSISVTPPDPNAIYVSPIDAVTFVEDYKTNPYEPHPTVKPNESSNVILEEGIDYELQYFGNDHAGTATMVMVGKGETYGNTALVRSFIIRQAEGALSYPHATLTVDYKNGDAVTTNDLVKTGDGTMTFTSSEPTVASVNANGVVTMLGVGTTTITASMSGDKNYTEATASYVLEVVKRSANNLSISLSQDSYVYDGTAHRPSVVVTDNGRELLQGTDYTVSYSDNTDQGTATVTVTGSGDYNGTATKNFTITEAPNKLTINNLEIKHDDSDAMKVSISASLALSLPVGGMVNRGATATWGSPIYTSSNTNVATVSNTGVLSAVAGGTTTVTVTVEEPASKNYYGVSITYTVTVVEVDRTFTYTGSVQEWTCQLTGRYLLSVWGAEGASPISTYSGGKGAYIAGSLYIQAGQKLYIYVGGKGQTSGIGGWNGGGSCTNGTKNANCSGGGGATDISINNGAWDSDSHLRSRIIVAGGGGGALYYNSGSFFNNGWANGGYGGAWNGRAGTGSTNPGGGGTLSEGGRATGTNANAGSFGKGGNYSGSSAAGCGGGGWFGGGSGGDNGRHGSGGGGSSYLWNNSNKSYYSSYGGGPSTDFYLQERGKSYGVRSGDGEAKITFISTD